MRQKADRHIKTVALLQRLCNRDEQSLRELYDLHGGLIFGIAFRLLRDRTEAEQLLIDVFTELWQHACRYDAERGDPVTYIVMLTRSRALDRLRSGRSRTASSAEPLAQLPAGDLGPAESAVASESVEILHHALAQLSEEERAAVEMSFFEGLSHTEIAEKLHKPLGTIKTNVRQGLIHLRGLLRTLWQGDREQR